MKKTISIIMLSTITLFAAVNFDNSDKFMKEKKVRYMFADKGMKAFKDFKTCTIRAKGRSKINKCERELRQKIIKLNRSSKNAKNIYLTK